MDSRFIYLSNKSINKAGLCLSESVDSKYGLHVMGGVPRSVKNNYAIRCN